MSRNNLDLVAKPLSSPTTNKTNEYKENTGAALFYRRLDEQIDAPCLLQGLVEGTRLDLPLGWLSLYADHPPVVAAGGGGSPQRLLQSLATETPVSPSSYYYAFFPQSILGSNSNSSGTLAFLSEVQRLDVAIYGYIDKLIKTNPGSDCRGAYFNHKSQF